MDRRAGFPWSWSPDQADGYGSYEWGFTASSADDLSLVHCSASDSESDNSSPTAPLSRAPSLPLSVSSTQLLSHVSCPPPDEPVFSPVSVAPVVAPRQLQPAQSRTLPDHPASSSEVVAPMYTDNSVFEFLTQARAWASAVPTHSGLRSTIAAYFLALPLPAPAPTTDQPQPTSAPLSSITQPLSWQPQDPPSRMPNPPRVLPFLQSQHEALLRLYEEEHDPMLVRAVDTVADPATYDDYMDAILVEINQTAFVPDLVTTGLDDWSPSGSSVASSPSVVSRSASPSLPLTVADVGPLSPSTFGFGPDTSASEWLHAHLASSSASSTPVPKTWGPQRRQARAVSDTGPLLLTAPVARLLRDTVQGVDPPGFTSPSDFFDSLDAASVRAGELFNDRVSAGLDSITGRPSSPLASLQPIEWMHLQGQAQQAYEDNTTWMSGRGSRRKKRKGPMSFTQRQLDGIKKDQLRTRIHEAVKASQRHTLTIDSSYGLEGFYSDSQRLRLRDDQLPTVEVESMTTYDLQHRYYFQFCDTLFDSNTGSSFQDYFLRGPISESAKRDHFATFIVGWQRMASRSRTATPPSRNSSSSLTPMPPS